MVPFYGSGSLISNHFGLSLKTVSQVKTFFQRLNIVIFETWIITISKFHTLIPLTPEIYSEERVNNSQLKSITFKIGQSDKEILDGRNVKVTVIHAGNKLIEVQKGVKETIMIRKFNPDSIVLSLIVEGLACKY